MKVHIENLAKVASADIEIDKITIIAGENNTGKSTIGKALFAILDTLSGLSVEQIEEARIKAIKNTCTAILKASDIRSLKFEMGIYGAFGISPSLNALLTGIADIVALIKKSESDGTVYNWERSLNSLLRAHLSHEKGIKEKRSDLEKKLKHEIQRLIEYPHAAFVASMVGRSLRNIFNQQINCVLDEFKDAAPTISLKIRNKDISYGLYGGNRIRFTQEIGIDNSAYGLDDITGDLKRFLHFYFDEQPEKALDELFVDEVKIQSMQHIYEKLSSIISGTFVKDKDTYSLRLDGFSQPLNILNLSDGLKFFALIKLLIENGLKERDVLILDEPETHLHPEWQIKFAEMIVMLQKELNLSVLISTHSPYMLEALNTYSAYYEIADGVNYYLSELDASGRCLFNNVTDDISKIYQKLLNPVAVLDEIKLSIK